jgi:hypothetical protein
MNKVIRKTTGTVLGLTLALVSGAPAFADDTELLLVAPPEPTELKPNVMFILDTSTRRSAIATRTVFITAMVTANRSAQAHRVILTKVPGIVPRRPSR